MSIRTGKEGYDSVSEFAGRTRKELEHREGPTFRKDTELPADDVAWVREQFGRHLEVLELGCGFGIWAPIAERCGLNYTGIDPVEDRVDYACFWNDYGSFLVGDARSVRLPEMFDAVLFVTVLQHMTLNDAILALKTASAHLEPGGEVIMIEARIIDESEEECERRYADPKCAAHMVFKPMSVLQEAVPELRWAKGPRFDQFILTKVGL